MARGGINKALVLQARQELLRKGVNPSVDATRVQLGNTGSKTTILRYLKEIEEEEGTTLEDEALLGKTLNKMVTQLASQLQSEAKSIVEKNEQACTVKIEQLSNEIKALKQQLTDAGTQRQLLEANLYEKELLITRQSEENQALHIDMTESHEKVNQLTERLSDKDNQIASLEEKHKHSREALEHYRQSVKEQRQQDLRSHEQQLHQLQAEQRNLNQTLIVKQEDITRLNTDNSRLVTELKNSQKENYRVIDDLTKAEQSLKLTQSDVTSLNCQNSSLNDEINSFKTQVVSMSEQIQLKDSLLIQLKDEMKQQISNNGQLEQEVLTAKVELKARNDIFEEIQDKFKVYSKR